ncbi:hypothetical protein [Streptomyces sp. SID3212]|uniref:hypothetical protein n=1 Tax=Streptomyces sp. SID3212 TaxID=2690259 RepID=UPI0013685569|nr:hypothetical protein [Streptomyces sp. SID3212]MYV55101.1 hypothetical protein [Streptomyces sp. SID3212]
MTTERTLASSEAMHHHLVDELNLALRRVGMYGELGTSMWFLMRQLLVLEQRPEVWDEQKDRWERRGLWGPKGVEGALARYFPSHLTYAASSVYTEFAREEGWLRPDRVLDAERYAELRDTAGPWAADDRTWTDVTAAFGPPSVQIGGSNPRYSKTLCYVTDDLTRPMVAFHLWNGTDQEERPTHETPLLLAVRSGEGPITDTLTFTPQGRSRRPKDDDWNQCR